MHALVIALSAVNSVLFAALGVLTVLRWRQRRDRATGWLALAFVGLGLLVTIGRLIPAHPHGIAVDGAQRIDIELLVLFPFLLYRFATAFVPPSATIQRIVGTLTIGLSVSTFALPRVPAAGEPRPWWFQAFVIAFLVHWTVLSILVTLRLWRAGRRQPSVARNRMRMLAFAAATITVAIIGVAFSSNDRSSGAATVQAIALVSAIAFLLGLEPPGIVRGFWRQPENRRLQDAIRSLMTLATNRAEIAERVLVPAADVVGARGAAIYADGGDLLAAYGKTEGNGELRVVQPGATLVAWTSPYAPFFGDDEVAILETITALTGIALDRVRLFEQEHESRLAFEHANEVMANFIALAAHELRTPVTTVHGFVQTLNHLGERLDEQQTQELRTALEQQTARMAGLVEQLLDLSRLDAEAIDVHPQTVDVRASLEDVVRVAAGARASEIAIEVTGEGAAHVDPAVLDHIVTNLVTNALRYGRSPVRVSATLAGGQLRITVEDSGPGVAHEIEETLFERFARAGVARDRVAGTGLGLAIARAYARAHRGDLRYEPGQPSGARFVVELPSV